MSAFSAANFDTARYAKSRPVYPKELFEHLVDKADNTGLHLCIDIGCGPGEATLELAKRFQRVIGVDPSPVMIEQAKMQARERGITNVEFVVANDEDFDQKIHGQADVITCAEAAHWIKNMDNFWKKVHEKLSPGGVAAIWGYVDPIFPNRAANEMYLDTMYNPQNTGGLAKYWEQPGRDKLKSLYQGMDAPKNLFAETVRIEGPSDTAEGRLITISKTMTIPEVTSYLKTFSSYARWVEANNAHLSKTSLAHGYTERGVEGDDPHPDVVDELMRKMGRASGWRNDSSIVLQWQSVLLMGVKE